MEFTCPLLGLAQLRLQSSHSLELGHELQFLCGGRLTFAPTCRALVVISGLVAQVLCVFLAATTICQRQHRSQLALFRLPCLLQLKLVLALTALQILPVVVQLLRQHFLWIVAIPAAPVRLLVLATAADALVSWLSPPAVISSLCVAVFRATV